MTVIKINAITVPADSGDELAHRFAARAGAVDGQPGFEGFELLKPTDADRHVWLVVTRWKDEESFQAWVNSDNFAEGHARTAGAAQGGQGQGQGQGHGHSHDAAGAQADAHGGAGGEARRKPVGLSAELWNYEVAGGSAGRGA